MPYITDFTRENDIVSRVTRGEFLNTYRTDGLDVESGKENVGAADYCLWNICAGGEGVMLS